MAFSDSNQHVFVLGSARSGTSLMASIVQNAPEYASYRAETKLLNSCRSKYGDLANAAARKRFLDDWFNSRQFSRSELGREEVLQATSDVTTYSGFLGTYMNMVAERQGCRRWVDSTPSNLNCLREIAAVFPQARVLHMVRDGRAVAMSLAKLGWSGARTTDFDKGLIYAALKWQVAVDRVYADRHYLGERYLQVKYEDLVTNPTQTLARISDFLQISAFDTSMFDAGNAASSESVNSSLRTPNSLFGDMEPGLSTNAAFRWKTGLSAQQIATLEMNIGASLSKYDYALTDEVDASLMEAITSHWRRSTFGIKRLLKHHTPLGRFSVSPLEIGEE